MVILQIEHPVQDFGAWKRVFDNDPAKRKEGGVQRYKILQPAGDPKYVIVHLEFDDVDKAKSFQEVLKKLWTNVDGKLINTPQSKIIEVVESKELL